MTRATRRNDSRSSSDDQDVADESGRIPPATRGNKKDHTSYQEEAGQDLSPPLEDVITVGGQVAIRAAGITAKGTLASAGTIQQGPARAGHQEDDREVRPQFSARRGTRTSETANGEPSRSSAAARKKRRKRRDRASPPTSPRSIKQGEILAHAKALSTDHEREVATALGGQRVRGSGSLGAPGDVRTNRFLVSCKRTTLRVFDLKLAEIEKATEEADAEALTPLIALRFDALASGDLDWILVPLRVLAAIGARARTTE